jgi:hypothetical protein
MLIARQVMWGVEPTKRRKRPKPTQATMATAPARRSKRTPRQLSLAEVRTRGGPRKGSGRKPKVPGARPNVVHRARPEHPRSLPVHVTLRRAKGLPGFRSERLHGLLKRAIRDTRREGFHLAEGCSQRLVYVLANHLKHGEYDVGLLDPCSSGPWFTGWSHALEPPSEKTPVQPAVTWVLRKGWSTRGGGGPIRLGEVPSALR